METLTFGYVIPLLDQPPVYEEQNNASARENPEIVREIVLDMIAKGIVTKVDKKPHCVAPLGLVSKLKSDGSIKHRLIYDASRCLNLYVKDQHVSLTGLEEALEMTLPGDFQATFDLTSAYYHVKITESQRKYLGAHIVDENGESLYFIYNHLPFGLKCAVHCITKIMKPLLAFLHKQGIRIGIYIDDGRVLGGSKLETNDNLAFTYRILSEAGWQVEFSKSTPLGEASHLSTYLGFQINSSNMMVTLPDTKIVEIRNDIQEILDSYSIKIKNLAKVLGKIISTIPSHGFLAMVCSRSGYVMQESHVQSFGWKGKIVLNDSTKRELSFFASKISSLNGSPIQSSMSKIRVDSIFPHAVVKLDKAFAHGFGTSDYSKIVSDASGFKVAAIDLSNTASKEFSFVLSKHEQSLASGLRELLAVEKTLMHWQHVGGYSNLKLFWGTDSENTVSFLSKGSSKPHVQKVCFHIAELCTQMKLAIHPIHLLRDDIRIQWADALSKSHDTDDWSIDQYTFDHFKSHFNLEIDAFANRNNARLPRFYSEFFEEGCEGVNAYAQIWKGVNLWLCPPVSELIQVAIEINKRSCQGVIIFPNWPTSTFFTSFISNGKVNSPFSWIKSFVPIITQNQSEKKGLSGKQHEFIALYFCNLV